MMNKVGGGTGGDDANGSMRPLGLFCLVEDRAVVMGIKRFVALEKPLHFPMAAASRA